MDKKYNKIVADRVQLDLFGQHSGSLAGFASDLVTKVRSDGGRILKPKNHRSLSELVEIDNGVAVDSECCVLFSRVGNAYCKCNLI